MGIAWHEYEIFELEISRVKQLQKDLRSLFYRNPNVLVQVLLRSLASQRQILAKGCATFICHAI